MERHDSLAGASVAVTRPAGSGATFARRIRALGGTPILLPGASLHAPGDATAARADLRAALAADAVIFTSPAAVRFAHRLGPLRGTATVLAPGTGTRRALLRAGVQRVTAPSREDSEGILALPLLQEIRGHHIGIVGAAGGRGLLERELTGRGAAVVHAHVYRRLPAHLDARHADALRRTFGQPLYILLSSAEALANILAGLPDDARASLLAGSACTSSARLEHAARAAGFTRVLRAPSAHVDALLAAVVADRPAAR